MILYAVVAVEKSVLPVSTHVFYQVGFKIEYNGLIEVFICYDAYLCQLLFG